MAAKFRRESLHGGFHCSKLLKPLEYFHKNGLLFVFVSSWLLLATPTQGADLHNLQASTKMRPVLRNRMLKPSAISKAARATTGYHIVQQYPWTTGGTRKLQVQRLITNSEADEKQKQNGKDAKSGQDEEIYLPGPESNPIDFSTWVPQPRNKTFIVRGTVEVVNQAYRDLLDYFGLLGWRKLKKEPDSGLKGPSGPSAADLEAIMRKKKAEAEIARKREEEKYESLKEAQNEASVKQKEREKEIEDERRAKAEAKEKAQKVADELKKREIEIEAELQKQREETERIQAEEREKKAQTDRIQAKEREKKIKEVEAAEQREKVKQKKAEQDLKTLERKEAERKLKEEKEKERKMQVVRAAEEKDKAKEKAAEEASKAKKLRQEKAEEEKAKALKEKEEQREREIRARTEREQAEMQKREEREKLDEEMRRVEQQRKDARAAELSEQKEKAELQRQEQKQKNAKARAEREESAKREVAEIEKQRDEQRQRRDAEKRKIEEAKSEQREKEKQAADEMKEKREIERAERRQIEAKARVEQEEQEMKERERKIEARKARRVEVEAMAEEKAKTRSRQRDDKNRERNAKAEEREKHREKAKVAVVAAAKNFFKRREISEETAKRNELQKYEMKKSTRVLPPPIIGLAVILAAASSLYGSNIASLPFESLWDAAKISPGQLYTSLSPFPVAALALIARENSLMWKDNNKPLRLYVAGFIGAVASFMATRYVTQGAQALPFASDWVIGLALMALVPNAKFVSPIFAKLAIGDILASTTLAIITANAVGNPVDAAMKTGAAVISLGVLSRLLESSKEFMIEQKNRFGVVSMQRLGLGITVGAIFATAIFFLNIGISPALAGLLVLALPSPSIQTSAEEGAKTATIIDALKTFIRRALIVVLPLMAFAGGAFPLFDPQAGGLAGALGLIPSITDAPDVVMHKLPFWHPIAVGLAGGLTAGAGVVLPLAAGWFALSGMSRAIRVPLTEEVDESTFEQVKRVITFLCTSPFVLAVVIGGAIKPFAAALAARFLLPKNMLGQVQRATPLLAVGLAISLFNAPLGAPRLAVLALSTVWAMVFLAGNRVAFDDDEKREDEGSTQNASPGGAVGAPA